MNVKIMKAEQIRVHVPSQPTYLVRVYDTGEYAGLGQVALRNSPYYRAIREYEFDDIDYPRHGKVVFTADIARKILTDFAQGRAGCEALIVHCTAGRNRSPAVALGLNQVFGLDADSWNMADKYKYMTRWIYKQMLVTAADLGLGTFRPFQTCFTRPRASIRR